MGSFHVYPSSPQSIVSYSRMVPLKCDIVEFDTLTKGHFDVTQHCFVADAPVVMMFHATVLIASPPNSSEINVWFFKNQLPTAVGASNGEIGGDNVAVCQPPPPSFYNLTARATRLLSLQVGDRVWAVPGINGGGMTTNAVNGGQNTCNYFEGTELS